MRSQVNFDIGFIEKTTIAYSAPVNRLFFVPTQLNRHREGLFSFLLFLFHKTTIK